MQSNLRSCVPKCIELHIAVSPNKHRAAGKVGLHFPSAVIGLNQRQYRDPLSSAAVGASAVTAATISDRHTARLDIAALRNINGLPRPITRLHQTCSQSHELPPQGSSKHRANFGPLSYDAGTARPTPHNINARIRKIIYHKSITSTILRTLVYLETIFPRGP